MSLTKITVAELSETVENELTLYSSNVMDGLKKQAKKSMDQLVKDTKETAPRGKRTKHYKDNITSKKTTDTPNATGYTWYVKAPDYRLSHLLENGHATRSGGRTTAYHFIKNASDPIMEDYAKKCEEVCKNG